MNATMYIKFARTNERPAVCISDILSAEFSGNQFAVTVPKNYYPQWLTLAAQGAFIQVNILEHRVCLIGDINAVETFIMNEE